jgi:hypothetical protein
VRTDENSAAILAACSDDWTSVAEIRAYVTRETGPAPTRTIQRRLPELVTRRALPERDTSTTKAYRTTGRI